MPRTPSPVEWITRRTRALGDPTRLRMVGLLARRPHYGEEFAEFLDLSAATVSHHLRILREADLVRSYRQSRHVLFALDEASVIETLEALRPEPALADLLELPSEEELGRRTVQRWLDEEGRIVALPERRTARAAVLRWAASHLEVARLYQERELRAALLSVAVDPDALREALLSKGWLKRSGAVYRRVEEVESL